MNQMATSHFYLKIMNQIRTLSFFFSNSFKLTFQRMPHLLKSGKSGMVFEHFQNYFHPEDLMNGFLQLFQLCFHIAQSHIPPQIACVFRVARLLSMTKPFGGVHPITMAETLYQLRSCVICFQFHDTFATHFSPHQFGVAIKGSCETIFHGIRCTLDFHPD